MTLVSTMINFEFQNSFIFFLLSFFSLLCFLGFFFFKKPKVDLESPPSPPSLPIIGHLHLFLSPLIHKCFQKISSKYGPYLHLRIFHLPIVLVSSASMASEIFKAHDVNISFLWPTSNRRVPLFRRNWILLLSPWRLLEVHEETSHHKATWTTRDRAVTSCACRGA
ncbi:unnamed protein product [Brassica oleracea]